MLIDLSVPLNNKTPAYPGDPKIRIENTATYNAEGYCGHQVTLGTHTGTHVDAPSHMIEGGRKLDDYAPDSFIGTAKCFDARGGFDIDACEKIAINKGDIVLFWTGMADKYNEDAYFLDFPVMSSEFADFLVSKQIKMVGIDTCSADNTEDFPVHKKLLSNDILIVECMTNLDKLPTSGFEIVALPIKLQVDAAPVRAIARIPV